MEKNISEFRRGLNKDNSDIDTPKGTYKFALNAINKTKEGNSNLLSNEESNIECFKLTPGYIPLGKVYIGDGEIAILSHNPDLKRDEIGVVNKYCEYEVHVNTKLDFKITNQIDLTYRLRAGCDKTIYWVDGQNNPPMHYVFSKPGDFKTGGFWDKIKFNIEETYSLYPEITNIEVLEGVGSLLSGSISVGIQYVDSSLNKTQIISTSSAVNIYVDSLTGAYLDIQGSITNDMISTVYPPTSKALKVTLNLDQSFPYYRLAFIEYVSGNGQLTSVKYTDFIPTSTNTFTYTGTNFLTEGVETDILMGGKSLNSGDSIEQINNRLIIANTTGQTGDFCKLQSEISKVTADLFIKRVSANSLTSGNTKSPTNHFEAVGYMPKEIYSFGLVLLFKDKTESPVYHIPGKNSSYGSNHVFSPGTNVYPMSIDNISENKTYINNTTCSSGDYWGKDSYGLDLNQTPIRHHRFPSRLDIGVPMVDETSSSTTTIDYVHGVLSATGTIGTPCTQDEFDNGECSVVKVADPFQIRLTFNVDGIPETAYLTLDPEEYKDPSTLATILFEALTEDYLGTIISGVQIEEEQAGGSWVIVPSGTISPKGLEYTFSSVVETKSKTKNNYFINVYGIKFSNIDITSLNLISDKEIEGYYIVRNERKENDKTILDSAILTPCVNSNNAGRNLWGKHPIDTIGDYHKTFDKEKLKTTYLANGLLSPVFNRSQIQNTPDAFVPIEIGAYSGPNRFLNADTRVSREFFGFLNPEFKFRLKKYENLSRISQQGNFSVTERFYNTFVVNDVVKESTYDPAIHKNKFKDNDGYVFRGGVRDSKLNFSLSTSIYNFASSDIKDIDYLKAVEDKDYIGLSDNLWNLSGDNRTGILRLNTPTNTTLLDSFPYVYFEKDIPDPYFNFRSLPYYKITHKLHTTPEVIVFEGDTYITPMRYFSSLFIGNQNAFRVNKNSVWKIILGSVLTVVLAAVSFFVPPVAAALPYTIGLITSGISEQKLYNAYSTQYNQGLSECLIDADTFNGFKFYPSEDDEVQWFGECLTDIWYESNVNISLRYDLTDSNRRYFMDAPGNPSGNSKLGYNPVKYVNWGVGKDIHLIFKSSLIPSEPTCIYLMNKTLENNAAHAQNKKYIGHPAGEVFFENPDFDRMNKQKVFFHLGLEYDCCSSCQEEFPHRVWYSEQSFQEELSDNYKVFLPQNYRDIEGETGRITDLFKIQDNLYIHTEEALWHLPQNLQERVTNQMTTFIGTGEFFDIPPRKILDDEQSSAGTHHKWATNKNETGVYFVTEKESKFYRFDGQNLKSINPGIDKWLNLHMPLQSVESSKKVGLEFKDFNNPSNPFGSGFISVYDTENKRVIFTKKDFKYDESLLEEGQCYCSEGGKIYVNPYYQDIIDFALTALNPADFLYLNGCDMVFKERASENIVVVNPYTLNLIVPEEDLINTSWTLSFDPYSEGFWVSWHSYLPNFYFKNNNKFYSWQNFDPQNNFWVHGVEGSFQNFYGDKKPFIVEYVAMSEPLKTKIFDDISIHTEARKYNSNLKEYHEEKNVTFNKGIFYNSRQCTGELTFKVKDLQSPEEDFMIQQVTNLSPGTIVIDRNEKDWHLNDIRDIRIDHTESFFDSNINSLQNDYFIDKILNNSVLNVNRDWTDQESLRDKYLVVRLIFDTFDDVKLILNYTVESEVDSI